MKIGFYTPYLWTMCLIVAPSCAKATDDSIGATIETTDPPEAMESSSDDVASTMPVADSENSTIVEVRSVEELEQIFDAAVAQVSQCETADECVLVSPDCPFGCWAAVRGDSEDSIIELAELLGEEAEQSGAQCEYKCADSQAACEDGTCATVKATGPV